MHPLGRSLLFWTGIAVLAATLSPPLSTASHHLFSAHMLQHLLVILAVAPLLVLSRKFEALLALPAVRAAARPVPAWLGFVCVFLIWHWPVAFRWAAQSEATRLLEHGSILVTAFVFWSVALSARGNAALSYGGRALFVMAAAVATDLPGVLMIFARDAYSMMPHEDAIAWGLTPMQDQQIAGLLMWVPANIVFFSLATWLFAQWISDDREPAYPSGDKNLS